MQILYSDRKGSECRYLQEVWMCEREWGDNLNTMQDDGIGRISNLNTDINGTYLSNLSINGSTMKRLLEWYGDDKFKVVRIYLDREGIKHYVVEYDEFKYVDFYERYRGAGEISLLVDRYFRSKEVKFC